MKKLLLAIVLCTSFGAFSQIEVLEKTKKIESRISYAYIEKDDKGKQYDFYFKNMNSVGHEYVKFSFRDNDMVDYNALYGVIENGFKEVPRDPVRLKANGELVALKYVNDNDGVRLQFQLFTDGDNPESMAVSKLFTADDMKALFKK